MKESETRDQITNKDISIAIRPMEEVDCSVTIRPMEEVDFGVAVRPMEEVDCSVTIRSMEAKDVVEASKIEAEVFSMPWKAEDFLEMVEAPYAYYFVACVSYAPLKASGEASEMAVDASDVDGEVSDVAVDASEVGSEISEKSGEAERIVGIIGLRDIAGEAEITNVAVKGEYRGLGIGRKLLEKALDQCSQLKINDVTLEVRASNQVAINLYESVGFKGEGYRPNFYEHPTEDALIMWKR